MVLYDDEESGDLWADEGKEEEEDTEEAARRQVDRSRSRDLESRIAAPYDDLIEEYLDQYIQYENLEAIARIGALLPRASARVQWLVRAFLHADQDKEEAVFAGRGYGRTWLDQVASPPDDRDVCAVLFDLFEFAARDEDVWKHYVCEGMADEFARYWPAASATKFFQTVGASENWYDKDLLRQVEGLAGSCDTPTAVHWFLAFHYHGNDQHARAAPHWVAALRSENVCWDLDDYVWAMQSCGVARDYANASRLARQVEERLDDDVQWLGLLGLAWVYWRAGAHKEARRILQRLPDFGQPRRFWLWVTRPDYYLECDGAGQEIERTALHPVMNRPIQWSCERATRAGDLVLLWRTRPESNIAYLWLVITDAEVDAEWGHGCVIIPLYYFDAPLTIEQLRADPRAKGWDALGVNFQGKAFLLSRENWTWLIEKLTDLNPDFDGFLKAARLV